MWCIPSDWAGCAGPALTVLLSLVVIAFSLVLESGHLFVCLLVCLFVCLLACMFVCSFVLLFVCLCVCLLLSLLVRLFVCVCGHRQT